MIPHGKAGVGESCSLMPSQHPWGLDREPIQSQRGQPLRLGTLMPELRTQEN